MKRVLDSIDNLKKNTRYYFTEIFSAYLWIIKKSL